MQTMVATASVSSNDALKAGIADLKAQLEDNPPSLVLFFASTSQTMQVFANELSAAFSDAKVLGASTAGEFTEKGDTKNAASIFAVAGDFSVQAGLGTGLKGSVEKAVSNAVFHLPLGPEDGFSHRTGIVLLDPLAGNGEEASLLTSMMLGGDFSLAGGAAGDDLKMSATYVSCGTEVATDAITVAVVSSKKPLGLGVKHGHKSLSGPLRITRSEGAVVYEINGRPAFDVWAEETKDNAGLDPHSLQGDDVGAFLLTYEAGLAVGSELKVRAPLSKGDDGSLIFACGIPEGAVIRITESNPQRQIDSASTAAEQAFQQVNGECAGAVVFDCICRNLILGDGFETAVRDMSKALGDVKIAGFETYGEVALDMGEMSGFHNTTTVLLAFPR
ncbi:MAG: hypothetical protein GY822_18210 [Deltaproteobacteria bacterium]|nr:hypothetical protein [Deltaproteobacteria bacterium]